MEPGSLKRVLTLMAGILAAFFIASVLSHAVVVLFQLKGWNGEVISFVVYAVFFLAVLHLLQKYAHIVFFGFDLK
jgi:hypothetical protein